MRIMSELEVVYGALQIQKDPLIAQLDQWNGGL